MPRTREYEGSVDYQEGFNGAGPVYMGAKDSRRSRQLGRNLGEGESLRPYYMDIDRKGVNSVYHHCVLYPERRQVGAVREEWTYEKNQAFWAGAIDANREFILVTPIEHYAGSLGFAVKEMLWLVDNGYTFAPEEANLNRTRAIPPHFLFRARIEKNINLYDRGRGVVPQMVIRRDRIIETVLLERAVLIERAAERARAVERARAEEMEKGWKLVGRRKR